MEFSEITTEIVKQSPIAGAYLLLVVLFLRHIDNRATKSDEMIERIVKEMNQASTASTQALQENTKMLGRSAQMTDRLESLLNGKVGK